MTNRKLFLIACAAAFAFLGLNASEVSAQPSSTTETDKDKDAPQMVIKYGQGIGDQRRKSHHGEMEPVGVPVNQAVAITLEFPKKRAGEFVIVAPIDGGQIAPAGPLTISRGGTVDFTFQAGPTTGVYHLLVSGADQNLLSLYAVDSERPGNSFRPHRNP
jgi:hypothetical protein